MLDPTRRFPEPPPRREPVFNIPPSIVAVLILLVGIHGLRQMIPEGWDNEVLLRLSFLPGTFTYAMNEAAVTDALRDVASRGEAGLQQAQFGRSILMSAGLEPWTVLTYGLLHADWTHIGLNGLWLLAFGSPVARRLGALRFGLFLLAATLAGALAHYVTHPFDFQPVIGASAAVSGCMGATLRFAFQPRVPVTALIGVRADDGAGAHPPLLSLRALLRDRRAVTFLLAWFLTNLLFGVGIMAFGSSDPNVAWQAHIGGFLLGILAFPLFDPAAPPPVPRDPDPASEESLGPRSPTD